VEDIPQNYSLIELQENKKETSGIINYYFDFHAIKLAYP
jgi:hypothetical protein